MMSDVIGYFRLNGNYIGKQTDLQGFQYLIIRKPYWHRADKTNRSTNRYVKEKVTENDIHQAGFSSLDQ
jgi:hypothetical protein